MKKLAIIKLGIVIILLLTPLIAFGSTDNLIAQVQIDPSLRPEYAANIEVSGGNRAAAANALVQLAAGGLIYVAGPIAILMLAYGGLRYVTSHGDQTQMEEAKKTIMWSVIGLLVIVFSWAIVTNVMWIALRGGELGTDQPPKSTPEQGAQTTANGTTTSEGDTVE